MDNKNKKYSKNLETFLKQNSKKDAKGILVVKKKYTKVITNNNKESDNSIEVKLSKI